MTGSMIGKLASAILIAASAVACGGAEDSAQGQKKVGQRLIASARIAGAPSEAVVVIQGYRANYTLVRSESGIVSVTDKLTNVTTTYDGAKLIKFFDKWTSLDVDGPDGQVYRLYQAAFNRKPDLPGLGFWIQAVSNGHNLVDIAGSFISSDEFKARYGENVPSTSFINSLYQNILDREGETEGFNWWVNAVNNGADRKSVLFGFSDSAENKANLLADMNNGFDYVPFNVVQIKPSSYENKVAAGAVLGPQQMPSEVTYSNSVAFGDFFRDGTYSMVTHTLEYFVNGTTDKTRFGNVKFYKRSADGNWIENTSALLIDTKGCLHPRKAISADFNGDGQPDVFFACQGFDGGNFEGEQPHILLSQTNGTYKNVTLPITCFCHAASAVDFNGNGFADILVTDTTVQRQPFFLRNNKNGTFTTDIASVPASLKNKLIFSAEIIDFNSDGKYDIWFGGHEIDSSSGSNDAMKPRLLINDGKNSFLAEQGYELPVSKEFGLPLDVVFQNNKIYMLRTNIEGGHDSYETSYYSKAEVQVVDLKTLNAFTVYRHEGRYPNNQTWVNWLIPYNGSVVAMDKAYSITVN